MQQSPKSEAITNEINAFKFAQAILYALCGVVIVFLFMGINEVYELIQSREENPLTLFLYLTVASGLYRPLGFYLLYLFFLLYFSSG